MSTVHIMTKKLKDRRQDGMRTQNRTPTAYCSFRISILFAPSVLIDNHHQPAPSTSTSCLQTHVQVVHYRKHE